MKTTVGVLLLVITTLVIPGLALRCYSCDPKNASVPTGACGDPFNETFSTEIECWGEGVVCAKVVARTGNNMSSFTVGRTCSGLGSQTCNKARDGIKLSGNRLNFCKTCTTDLCNEGSRHLGPLTLTAVLAVLMKIVLM